MILQIRDMINAEDLKLDVNAMKVWIIIVVTIASLAAGYFISRYANKISENRIINAFKEELKNWKP